VVRIDNRVYDRADAATTAALLREAAGGRSAGFILYVGPRGPLLIGRTTAAKATPAIVREMRRLGEWSGPHPRARHHAR